MIPWRTAVSVAASVAGTHPLAGTYHEEILAREAPDLVARAEPLVEEATGLRTVGTPGVEVVSRAAWAERNVAFFAHLMDPLETRLEQRFSRVGPLGKGGAAVARQFVALETGALLGVLGRRVLGQYELALPTDVGDTIYLVGPNILALERAHQFRPIEFRFWLALHECTHRLQFVGIPWMRDYFLSLVEELAASARPDPRRFVDVAARAAAAVREGRPLVDETGLFGLFANDEQRSLLDKVQALMSLLEGHGHVVMDRIGEELLLTRRRMSTVLKLRRSDPKTAAFFRLTGIEMKLRQYELGERFIQQVEALAGWGSLAAAWQGPDYLPTLFEIEHPRAWLDRVA